MSDLTMISFMLRYIVTVFLVGFLFAAESIGQQGNTHVVQEGETLTEIARMYGTTASEIRQHNSLRSDDLRIGQRLVVRIWSAGGTIDSEQLADVGPSLPGVRPADLVAPDPIPAGPPPPAPPPSTITQVQIGYGAMPVLVPSRSATPSETPTVIHTVVAGDTQFNIARRYGTTVDALQRANNLPDDRIAVGQELIIPGVSGVAPPVQATPRPSGVAYHVDRTTLPDDEVHDVLRGETLFSIAARYGVTVAELLERNPMTTGPIPPGTILHLPADAGREYHREPAPPRVDEDGMALVYPASYIGRTTISGEEYSPRALTASHRELPFGTLLRVIATSTGNETLVRINDRGPVSEGFLIEISDAAAAALGIRPGSAEHVQIQVLR